MVVIIAGNPKGIYSAHHEKLVLIDSECPPHTVAFTGVPPPPRPPLSRPVATTKACRRDWVSVF